MDFPHGADGKGSACNAGDLGLIPGLGRSPGGRHGNLFQYPWPRKPHGQRSLAGYNHGVAKSQTLLSDSHSFTFLLTVGRFTFFP